MIENLLSPLGLPLQDSLSLAVKRKNEKEELMKKIGGLRHQMTELREQTHQIQQDQIEMRQIAVLIEKDQEDIENGQKSLIVHQDRIDQNVIQVRQNHKEIKLQTFILEQKWRDIFPQLINFRADQKHLQVRVQGVGEKKDNIHQQALAIRQNFPVIQQNLQEAKHAMENIPKQAARIQQDQQAIKIEIEEIEEKRAEIQNEISRLQGKLTENLPLEQEDQNPFNRDSVDFWSSLINKIKEFSLWTLLEMGYQIEQAHHRSKSLMDSTSFSNQTPFKSFCIAIIALGILSRTTVPEGKVSLEDFSCEGAFLIFKWKYQFRDLNSE